MITASQIKAKIDAIDKKVDIFIEKHIEPFFISGNTYSVTIGLKLVNSNFTHGHFLEQMQMRGFDVRFVDTADCKCVHQYGDAIITIPSSNVREPQKQING